MSDNKKSKPTPADLKAAENLRRIWDVAGRKPSQGEMALAWQERYGGGGQSLMSQYINGKIALNYRAVIFFADQLQVPPESIRDDLREQRVYTRSKSNDDLADKIRRLRVQDRLALERMVDSLYSVAEPEPEDTGVWRQAEDAETRPEPVEQPAPRKKRAKSRARKRAAK